MVAILTGLTHAVPSACRLPIGVLPALRQRLVPRFLKHLPRRRSIHPPEELLHPLKQLPQVRAASRTTAWIAAGVISVLQDGPLKARPCSPSPL